MTDEQLTRRLNYLQNLLERILLRLEGEGAKRPPVAGAKLINGRWHKRYEPHRPLTVGDKTPDPPERQDW